MPRVLIADDSMFQRKSLARLVSQEGVEVVEAKDGQECLDFLNSEEFDGVLLDINMPRMSGLEVLEAMKEQGLKVPVLVVSADIQDSTRERCLAAGACEMFNKPIDEDRFKKALHNLFSPL